MKIFGKNLAAAKLAASMLFVSDDDSDSDSLISEHGSDAFLF
jgi:hypothetical protein